MAEKKKDWEQFSTSLPIKFIKLLKLHGFKADTSLSKILTEYQNAYLKQLEEEKETKKLNKELEEKGKVQCPYCEQIVSKEKNISFFNRLFS
jgi:hypothetical protein